MAPHKVCPNCRVIPMVGPPHCLLHWEANVHRRALLRLVSGICLSVGREGTGKGGWEGGREGGRGWGREELERLVEGGIWEKVRWKGVKRGEDRGGRGERVENGK